MQVIDINKLFGLLFIAAIILLSMQNIAFCQSSVVIPQGQESIIENNVTPTEKLLPDGIKIQNINVHPDFLKLFFSESENKKTVVEIHNEIADNSIVGEKECVDKSPLIICWQNGKKPSWINAYIEFIGNESRLKALDGIWKGTRKARINEKLEEEKQVSYLGYVSSYHDRLNLGLWFIVLLILIWMFWSGFTTADQYRRYLFLIGGCAHLIMTLVLFKDSEIPDIQLFISMMVTGLFCVYGLFQFYKRHKNEIEVPVYTWIICIILLIETIITTTTFLHSSASSSTGVVFVAALFVVMMLVEWIFSLRNPDSDWNIVFARVIVFLSVITLACLLFLGLEKHDNLSKILNIWVLVAAVILVNFFYLTRKQGFLWLKNFNSSGWLWFVFLTVLVLIYHWSFADPSGGQLTRFHHSEYRPLIVSFATYFNYSVMVAAFVALILVLIKYPELLKKLGYSVVIGVGLTIPPALLVLTRMHEIDIDYPWMELEMAFQLLNNFTEPLAFNHHAGGAFWAAAFLNVLGDSAISFNIFRLIGLFLFSVSLVAISRVIFGNYFAGLFSVAVLSMLSSMPYNVSKSWWFFTGGAMMMIAITAIIVSVRKKSSLIFVFGILVLQMAFELRLESLVLLPLYIFIKHLYGFPNKRADIVVIALFLFNIATILVKPNAANEYGIEHFSVNAIEYIRLWGTERWLISLSLIGFFVALWKQKREVLILPVWLAGIFTLYIIVNTAPTESEALLIYTPALIMVGGIFAGDYKFSSQRTFSYLLLMLFLITGLVLYLNEQDREWKMRPYVDEIELSREVVEIAKKIEKDAPVLLDPIYMKFALPEMKYIFERADVLGENSLPFLQQLEDYDRAYCFDNKQGKKLKCCYIEIDSIELDLYGDKERDDKYQSSSCLPVSAFDREVKVVKEGKFTRLIKLTKRR